MVTLVRISTLTVTSTSPGHSKSGSVLSKPQQRQPSQEVHVPSNTNKNNDNDKGNVDPQYKNDRGIPSTFATVPPGHSRPPSPHQDDRNRQQRSRYLADPNSTIRLLQAVGGPHFLTPLSGCRMARWILPLLGDERPFRRDCYKEVQLATAGSSSTTITSSSSSLPTRLLSNETIHLVQSNDTIYVAYDQVHEFVSDILPWLHVEVILLSGQASYVTSPLQSAIDQILENPWIVQWFGQNLAKYGGINPYHSKWASFPFGIKQRAKDDPLVPTNGVAYKTVFYQSLNATLPNNYHHTPQPFKNQSIFVGYVTVTSNLQYRSNVPISDKFLPPLDYYQVMARSHYVLSPNGDRPECYRHYEALGLGTAPITQLPRHDLFSHLEGSGLVYDLGIPWNDLSQLQQHVLEKEPIVHRNLVLEEYWMDYVDWYVGRALTWWDRYRTGMPAQVTDILKDFL